MKKIITTLFLFFYSFSPASLADNATDFLIEGISLYESALNHFPERQIKNNKQKWYATDEYYTSSMMNLPKFKTFKEVQLSFKKGDKKYIILSIDGVEFMNFNDCLKELEKTTKDLNEMFKDAYHGKKATYPHAFDKTGNSKVTDAFWKFNSGDKISIMCVNWGKEVKNKLNYKDEWRVRLGGEEFGNFLNNAYK